MKTVVTGAAGFIGANLVRRLIELRRDMRCVDNIPSVNLKGKPGRAILGTRSRSGTRYVPSLKMLRANTLLLYLSEDKKKNYSRTKLRHTFCAE